MRAVRIFGREPWDFASRALMTVGGLGFAVMFLWFFGLIAYYSSTRPRSPSREQGWNVPLEWTHGFYGTPKENQRLLRVFNWAFPFFIVGATGAMIRQQRQKKEPWRKKQF